ncbi:MAG: hypothetical protein K6E29_00575 [Cyanobacteria bacterium RUI128]|nr:hypothetical protein [Cyanobacteria bacterium RUI128]
MQNTEYSTNVFSDNSLKQEDSFITEGKLPEDGADDGSISFTNALKNIGKGIGDFFKGMFCDENGDFSLGNTLKTVLIGAGIAAACILAPEIVIAGTAFSTLGVISAGFMGLSAYHIGSAVVDAHEAETDAEAEQAFRNIGSGLTEGTLAFIGCKSAGKIIRKAPTTEPPGIGTKGATKSGKTTNTKPQTTAESEVAENVQNLDNVLAERAQTQRVTVIDMPPKGEPINNVNPASIDKCEAHITKIKINASDGVSGGHASELYSGLRDTIETSINKHLDKMSKNLGIEISKSFSENNSTMRLKNVAVKDVPNSANEIEFTAELLDGTPLRGTLSENGTVRLTGGDNLLKTVELSSKGTKIHKNILNKNGAENVKRSVKDYLGDNTFDVKAVDIDADGNIVVSFGDTIRKLKSSNGANYDNISDVKLSLIKSEKGGVEIYKQKYTFKDKDGHITEAYLSNPKTAVPKEKLTKAMNTLREGQKNGGIPGYRVQNGSTETAAYIFKQDGTYYWAGFSKTEAGLSLNTMYPVYPEFLTEIGCVAEQIPDLSGFVFTKTS